MKLTFSLNLAGYETRDQVRAKLLLGGIILDKIHYRDDETDFVILDVRESSVFLDTRKRVSDVLDIDIALLDELD